MCLGASECLKCGRWLQPLPLTSNEARQTAASLRSGRNAPNSQTKANGKGGNHICGGLQNVGSYGTVHSATLLALKLLTTQGCCCMLHVRVLPKAGGLSSGIGEVSVMSSWAAGIVPCQRSS